MERVSFLHVESSADFIVSFAIESDDSGSVNSLTLLRTPKYELVLPEAERGVTVSHEGYDDLEPEYLSSLELTFGQAIVTTKNRTYVLDLSRIDKREIEAAEEVLRRMNFDNRFQLQIA